MHSLGSVLLEDLRGRLHLGLRQAWNMGDMFPGAGKQRTAESMTGTTWLSSQRARILREPGGTSKKATAP